MVYGILFVMLAVTFAALKLSRKLSRTALELSVLMLLIGAAGYVWQGSPSLPESQAQGDAL